ncbi:MAG: Hsp70 family protein [Acidobacteria bacterium]|nr:Hsp70 family protein [Acidobacteriota bacterium]
MKLGIDFGTTRIVVAAVDRGNYPVVSFDTPDGSTAEWFPPLVAVSPQGQAFGWEAYAHSTDPDWTVVRSLKRILEDAGPNTQLEIGTARYPVLDLVTQLASALADALRHASSAHPKKDEPFEIMLGVPANANSNQRFLTAEAFRRAGFSILGIANEPSAASVEFAHRNKADLDDKQLLLVYDLGGGTFDASLVQYDERTHRVLASEGITTLGGDDFDQTLAELALSAAGVTFDSLTPAETFRLLEQCRIQKEALHPNTKKIVIDLEEVNDKLAPVTILASEFYEHATPYVEETRRAVHDLLERHGNPDVEWLYITGGGSELPLVSRLLKEDFGRRVKRSAYTRSATAIGLAIQADATSGYTLQERFTRFFGVWREADSGTRIIFDPLFPKGTPLPATTEDALSITRQYTPAHNIGHFRYLECSHLAADGQPAGDITLWDEILFPFDPALAQEADLATQIVATHPESASQQIEEEYRCDSSGAVSVLIHNRTAGYDRTYPLGRWSVATKPVRPTRKPRKRST